MSIYTGYNDTALAANEASNLLKGSVRDFLGKASLAIESWHEITNAERSDDNKCAELLLDLPIEYLTGEVKGIAAAAGLGKTSSVIEELKNFNGIVWFLIPDMELAEEIRQAFISSGHKEVHLFRGRNEYNCKRFGLSKQLSQHVSPDEQSVGQAICKNGDELCPHYESCPYIAQIDNIKNSSNPAIIIMAHNYLTVHVPMPVPDLVVIDESHWQKMIGTKKIKVIKLYGIVGYNSTEADEYQYIIKMIEHALRWHPQDYLEELRKLGIKGRKDLQPALDFLEKLKKDTKSISPKYSDDKIRSIISQYEATPPVIAKARYMLEMLGEELSRPRNTGHLLRMYNDTIVVHTRKNPRSFIHPRVPVLLLDASANKTINSQVWGKKLNHLHIPARRNVIVHQVIGRQFSKQSITGKMLYRECRPEEAAVFRNEIIEFVNTLPGIVFAAGTKEVITLLKPHFRDGVHTGHFAALRGKNKFIECNTAVILGREQPSPEAMETQGRALWFDSNVPLNFAGQYDKALKKLPLANGGFKDLSVYVHPDANIHAILEQIREEELSQTLDRLRLIHIVKPKTVYNLNSVAIPGLTVDFIHSWDELIKGGNRIERALKRIMDIAPAFPLGYTELLRLHPDLWQSADAVKADIARHGGIKWVENQIIYYYLQSDTFISVEYRRPGQRGKASPAIISAGLKDPRKALELVVGNIIQFKLKENV
jgi:hypothetical protein